MHRAEKRIEKIDCDSFGGYRYLKVNGVMTKVNVSTADAAFKAAMKVRAGKRKNLDKELLIHGVIQSYF